MLNRKVLFVASASFWGGATVALFNMIVFLKQYFEIRVVVPCKGKLCDELDSIGVRYYIIPSCLSVWPRGGWKIPYRIIKMLIVNHRAKRKFEEIIQEYRPHLVHNNVGPLDISFDICNKYEIPHVWHIREYQDLDFNLRFFPSKRVFERKIHSKGNYNVAITRGVFDYWKLRGDNDVVIYDGVINSMKEKKQTKNNPYNDYFLFVGRVEPAKGLLMVLHAFEVFAKSYPNEKLLIAGSVNADKCYYQKCLAFINEKSLAEKVLFLGERDDVYALMSNANALVVASRFEGFGFITAEAMYCQCPVIGKNTAGTKEQFDNCKEKTGVEVGLRFNDENDLLRLMKKVKSSKMEIERKIGRYVVEHNYTSEINAKKIMNFYEVVWKKNEILG